MVQLHVITRRIPFDPSAVRVNAKQGLLGSSWGRPPYDINRKVGNRTTQS